MSKNREEKKREAYFAYVNKEISIDQFRARMRELKYEEWEIDLFIDGDI